MLASDSWWWILTIVYHHKTVSSDTQKLLTIIHPSFYLSSIIKVFILIKAVNTLISLMFSVPCDICSLVSSWETDPHMCLWGFYLLHLLEGFRSLTLVEVKNRGGLTLLKPLRQTVTCEYWLYKQNLNLWIFELQFQFVRFSVLIWRKNLDHQKNDLAEHLQQQQLKENADIESGKTFFFKRFYSNVFFMIVMFYTCEGMK